MLRILAWRLIFEVLTLLKALGLRGADTHYFAFGGNLDPEVMKKRGMLVKAAEPVYAQGFTLKFNHDVPFEGIGMASMEKAHNSALPGVVYTIPAIDQWIMDCFEAYTVLRRYKKGVLILNAKKCFYYYSGRPQEGLLPSKTYLLRIVAGYKKAFGETSEPVNVLQKHPSIPEMLPRKPPRFLITNYESLGVFLKPALEYYDSVCTKVFVFLVFRPSIFQRFLVVQAVPMWSFAKCRCGSFQRIEWVLEARDVFKN